MYVHGGTCVLCLPSSKARIVSTHHHTQLYMGPETQTLGFKPLRCISYCLVAMIKYNNKKQLQKSLSQLVVQRTR